MLNDLRYSLDKPAVLLLGNYRPAVVIARALAKRGFRIILGSRGEEHGCRHSRSVQEVWDHPDLAQGQLFSDALNAFLGQRRDIGFVLPVTEEFSIFFAARREPMARDVTLVSPRAHVVETFSDKIKALNLAEKCDIATLPFELVDDYAGLLKNAEHIGFPLTIRPLGTTARLNGKKALILADAHELLIALPSWPDQHETLLLQRFASGNRHNVYFAARNGRIIAACESSITRTNQLDGTGLAVDGQTVGVSPILFEETQSLVAATGYTGIGLAQFIYEPHTGKRCFLELNPRVSGSHAVPEHAGVPLSALAVELATGLAGGCAPMDAQSARPAHTSTNGAGRNTGMKEAAALPGTCLYGKSDMRYVWTSGDLYGAKMAVINREIGVLGLTAWLSKTLLSVLRADAHMIWSLQDPLPAVIATLSVLPRLSRLRNWHRQAVYPNQVQSRRN